MLNNTQRNIMETYMNSGFEEILKTDYSIAIDFLESVTNDNKFKELEETIKKHVVGEFIIEWRKLYKDMNSHTTLNLSAYDDNINANIKASSLDVRLFINRKIDDHIKTLRFGLEKNRLLENERDNNVIAVQNLSAAEAALIAEKEAREDLEKLLINQSQEINNANQQLDFARKNITIPTSNGAISMTMNQLGDFILNAQTAIGKVKELEANQTAYIERKAERAPIKAKEKKETKESLEEAKRRADESDRKHAEGEEKYKEQTVAFAKQIEEERAINQENSRKTEEFSRKLEKEAIKNEENSRKNEENSRKNEENSRKNEENSRKLEKEAIKNEENSRKTEEVIKTNQENSKRIDKMENSNLNKVIDIGITVAGAAVGSAVTENLVTGTAAGASVSNLVGENVAKLLTTSYTPLALGQSILKKAGGISGAAVAKTAKDWVFGEKTEEKGKGR